MALNLWTRKTLWSTVLPFGDRTEIARTSFSLSPLRYLRCCQALEILLDLQLCPRRLASHPPSPSPRPAVSRSFHVPLRRVCEQHRMQHPSLVSSELQLEISTEPPSLLGLGSSFTFPASSASSATSASSASSVSPDSTTSAFTMHSSISPFRGSCLCRKTPLILLSTTSEDMLQHPLSPPAYVAMSRPKQRSRKLDHRNSTCITNYVPAERQAAERVARQVGFKQRACCDTRSSLSELGQRRARCDVSRATVSILAKVHVMPREVNKHLLQAARRTAMVVRVS